MLYHYEECIHYQRQYSGIRNEVSFFWGLNMSFREERKMDMLVALCRVISVPEYYILRVGGLQLFYLKHK